MPPRGNGIAKRTLERAKRELGITAEKNGQWYWRLPDAAKIKVATNQESGGVGGLEKCPMSRF
jgi:hypothetical protein